RIELREGGAAIHVWFTLSQQVEVGTVDHPDLCHVAARYSSDMSSSTDERRVQRPFPRCPRSVSNTATKYSSESTRHKTACSVALMVMSLTSPMFNACAAFRSSMNRNENSMAADSM